MMTSSAPLSFISPQWVCCYVSPNRLLWVIKRSTIVLYGWGGPGKTALTSFKGMKIAFEIIQMTASQTLLPVELTSVFYFEVTQLNATKQDQNAMQFFDNSSSEHNFCFSAFEMYVHNY